MKRAPAAAALSLLVSLAPAAHADDFDGRWKALGPQAGTRCWAGYLHLSVSDGTVTGLWESSGIAPILHMSGPVNADGSFQISGSGYVFNGDKVVAEWDGQCGHRVATGGRVVTPARW